MIRVTLRGGMPNAVRRSLERAGMTVSDPGDLIIVWFDGASLREDSVDERNLTQLSTRDEPILALVPRTDLVEQALRAGATDVLTSLPQPAELLARCAALVAYADRWRHRVRSTARKSQKAAEDLTRLRALLDRMMDYSPHPIVTADLRGKILHLNPAAERMFGYRSEDAIQHLHAADLYVDPSDSNRVFAEIRVSEGAVIEVQELRLRSRTGEQIPGRLIAGDILDAQGEPEGSFLLIVDLREVHALRARLEETAEHIIENERRVGMVRQATTVAHELNQPLTAVMGTIEMLELRSDLPPDVPARLARIYSQLERMARIVRQLGDVTRARDLEQAEESARSRT